MRAEPLPLTRLLLPALLLFVVLPTGAQAQGPNCVPSCEVNDGRFLAITPGGVLETLTDTVLEIQILVDEDASSFDLGFFDGSLDPAHWDVVNGGLLPGERVEYELFADKNNDGVRPGNPDDSDDVLLLSKTDSDMVDNAWVDFTVVNDARALAPTGGRYIYRLLLELHVSELRSQAIRFAIKVRVSAVGTGLIEVFEQPFSFIAAMQSCEDFNIIYPNLNANCETGEIPFPFDLSDSTYDGTFTFLMSQPLPQRRMVIWDGDLDRGSVDDVDCASATPGPTCDTDDLNSPARPDDDIDDGFSTVGVEPDDEGVAVVLAGECGGFPGGHTGCPPDDVAVPGGDPLQELYLRQPSITYQVYRRDAADPSIRTLVATNSNPSGDQEWEKFRIESTLFPPLVPDPQGAPDALTPSLPAAVYEVEVQGVDLENLNAFFFNRLCSMPECDPAAAGVGTPGYWKNHADAWPVQEVTIGGQVYEKDMAIFILDQGEKESGKHSGDKTYTLGAALICAILNGLVDNDTSCVSDTMLAADTWLADYPVGSNVRGSSQAWREGEPLYWELDDYNNGLLCGEARD